MHGGSCSPAAGVPSFAAYMALAGKHDSAEAKECKAAEWLNRPVAQPKETVQQQDTGELYWTSLETPQAMTPL